MAAYEHFAQVAGDVGTPGIAPTEQSALPSWLQWVRALLTPKAIAGLNPEHVTISPGGKVTPGPGLTPPSSPAWIPGGTIGGGAGGVGAIPPVDNAAKALSPSGWMPGLESWLTERGKVIGVYGLFLLVALVGLIFLLSAAGGSGAGQIVRKALA